MSPADEKTWGELGYHVLAELTRLSDGQDKLNGKLDDVRGDVRELKVKSGLWGMAGGAVVAALAWLKGGAQ